MSDERKKPMSGQPVDLTGKALGDDALDAVSGGEKRETMYELQQRLTQYEKDIIEQYFGTKQEKEQEP